MDVLAINLHFESETGLERTERAEMGVIERFYGEDRVSGGDGKDEPVVGASCGCERIEYVNT